MTTADLCLAIPPNMATELKRLIEQAGVGGYEPNGIFIRRKADGEMVLEVHFYTEDKHYALVLTPTSLELQATLP